MKLSDFEGKYFEVRRDGEFDELGILVSEPHKPYLCFAEAENYVYGACEKSDVSCIICTPQLADNPQLLASGKGIAVSEHPRIAFFTMHNELSVNDPAYARQSTGEPRIGANCRIHPTAVIGDGVIIGDDVTIEEYVIIRPNTIIGNGVVIRARAIIGTDGVLMCRRPDGSLMKLVQAGGVRICDGAGIEYNALIQKGMYPYEYTTIGKNCSIDGYVSHNCQIGDETMLLGDCIICGCTNVGSGARINPRSVVSNIIEVGDDATVSIGSVVVHNVNKGETVSGNFAISHDKFLKWHLKKLRETSGSKGKKKD